MVLKGIAQGEWNCRECLGIGPLCGPGKKSDGGDWKNSDVSVSRGSVVFFRSDLSIHPIVPGGYDFFAREKTGLGVLRRRSGA